MSAGSTTGSNAARASWSSAWVHTRPKEMCIRDRDVEDQVVRRLKTLCQEEDVAWEGTGPIAGVAPRLLARVKEEGLRCV